MKLTNTLTRHKEEFKPLQKDQVTLYTCGLTVYDHPHIGNWRTFIFYDTLARVLHSGGYRLKHVWNITDVGHLVSDADEGEDKMEKGAQREGKTAWQIAEVYTQEFYEGMASLNIRHATQMPKATDHIAEQIALIKRLEARGYTYCLEDGVYFDTIKLADYGKLTGQNMHNLRAGARVEQNTQKKDPADFALWKFSPGNSQRDMEWPSPWGVGFPGWHLECSAMAMRYLGETIDLHAGGVDHIGTHHTNEIAQSEAATGQPFVRLWLHGEYLLVDGHKMAKRAGNFYTLGNLSEHGFEPLAFRLLVLQAHYRSQLNFTWESLRAAQTVLKNLRAFAALSQQQLAAAPAVETADVERRIKATLANDLNTPQALAVLNKFIDATPAVSNPRQLHKLLVFLDEVLGLCLSKVEDIDSQTKKLIEQREQARSAKDFVNADKLRAQLGEQGIYIEDTLHGPVWKRS